ncbi:ABC transporter permease [Xanthovirga aplysinae]|uniref:ABC transporter permease n=1 Tax=Xanthovirga aplysinae TaxID=2529853 RepID=UPI0012BBD1F8|nr:ABC transporter permease [Xanthovirga aplysinae]MTI32491.1 ABC transporter permease [Xanthovirga aplysinae]
MNQNKLIIDANSSPFALNLKELFRYRDLFWVLAMRDFKVRYAQTFLGFLWAFIQPLATLIVLTFVFGKAVKVDTGGVPYPLFALSGMVAWTYFAFVMSQSGNSIIGAQEMVKKIYFPRLVIPLSKAIVGFVDLGITFLFMVTLMIFYEFVPSVNMIYLPFFLIMAVMAALSVGIWLSALTIRYRDFQHVVPFMVQFGLYATPIAYPASAFPEKYQWVMHLNPMAGVVEGFRWSILGGNPPSNYMYLSFVLVILLVFSALFYFKKVEKVMADIV